MNSVDETLKAIENISEDGERVVFVDYIAKDGDGNFVANDLCHAADLKALVAELVALRAKVRYALATFRALDQYTFQDSDHGLLIAEAVKKLESLSPDVPAIEQ